MTIDSLDWAGRLRADAVALFRAGVVAADPATAVLRHLAARGGKLIIGNTAGETRSTDWRSVSIVAFGKAAIAMASGAAAIVPKPLFKAPGIAVTNYENVAELPGFTVIGAGHPLPDANGVAAAKVVAETVGAARLGELVLVLISGGGSALLPYPVEGITFEDKIATTNLLLASGADIGEINTVRKHLSRLKGGGLARLAHPADLHALILSDVLGDDLSTIASGPTVPDPTTFDDAHAALARRGVWDKIPASVRRRIATGLAGDIPETPKPGDPVFARAAATLVGSNAMSLKSVGAAAERAGYRVIVYDDRLTGEARKAASDLVAAAGVALRHGGARPMALIAGGETTVTLKGKGRGGRNQEMALAFACAAEEQGLSGRWVFLSGGTDGRDGPTDAAGGVIDPASFSRITARGNHPVALLEDNDSYRALELSGDLLITGATGTNVADLQILLIAD
jgi:glycerate 2-kinase